MNQQFRKIPGRYHLVFERIGESKLKAWVPLIPSMRAEDGTMRAAALLMAVDMACGASAGLGVLPDTAITADSEVHFLSPVTRGPLRIESECLRAGRKMSVAEARLFDEGNGDALVAFASANHGVMTPSFEPPISLVEVGAQYAYPVPDHPEGESLECYFGLQVAGGQARAPMTERTCNPFGMFHGGLHGLIIESIARAEGVVTPLSVSIRFLNAVREGDAVARVVDRRERSGGELLRIEVRDSKNDRIASIAHVTHSEASGRERNSTGLPA